MGVLLRKIVIVPILFASVLLVLAITTSTDPDWRIIYEFFFTLRFHGY
jgi:hypothetical protein